VIANDIDAWTRSLIEDMREHEGRVTQGPMAGRPLMVLTTTGARTGKLRTAIVTYTRDDGRYVIAGSKSGAPTHPAWFHNLIANPVVTVEAGGKTFQARATVTEGPERDRLWNQHATERPEFRDYPNKTSRVIPMIVLEPI
jgi:deazaflavin-dependent oxidoreductase (nitroreductase family)